MQPPKYYKDTKLMDLLIEKEVPFAEANIMKYVFRWKEKNGLEDLLKARVYLDALIAHAELQLQPHVWADLQTNEGLLSTGEKL